MTTLEHLAHFVCGFRLTDLPAAAVDRLALHLFDALGAAIAGGRLDEGRRLGSLAATGGATTGASAADIVVPGLALRAEPDWAIVIACGACRSTEMDDIHLEACVTPGAVAGQVALTLASSGAIASPRGLLEAVAVGYEVMVRTGLAIDGPSVLGDGIWPTLAAAPLGACATAARAFGLDEKRTAGALATAAAMASGTGVAGAATTTARWATLGLAARAGVQSARLSSLDMAGNANLLDVSRRIAGTPVSAERLLADAGRTFRLTETGLKPYPIARQALAAVEAARDLARAESLEVSGIESVTVEAPARACAVVDRPTMPETRFAALVSGQYLVAVALVEPDSLADVGRAVPCSSRAVAALVPRIRWRAAADLDALYPAVWAGRVRVRTTRGDELVREVRHPPGDIASPLDRPGVIEKLAATCAPLVNRSMLERLAHRVCDLPGAPELAPFWDLQWIRART